MKPPIDSSRSKMRTSLCDKLNSKENVKVHKSHSRPFSKMKRNTIIAPELVKNFYELPISHREDKKLGGATSGMIIETKFMHSDLNIS